jgi:hypothetical protein
MKTNFTEKKRRFFRALFGTLSFTSAMFIFQACYGTPRDFGQDVMIEGIVKAKKTNMPIMGIKVSIENQPQYEFSDSSGKFKIYTSLASAYKLTFSDIDAVKNGDFLSKDTVIQVIKDSVYLNIVMNEK